MTFEELVAEAREAALENAIFEINGQEISEYLEDLQDHYLAADQLALHLGIAPQDAPAVSDLVAMVPGAMEKAREQGRQEAVAAMVAILQGIPHAGADLIAARLREAVPAPDREITVGEDGFHHVRLIPTGGKS